MFDSEEMRKLATDEKYSSVQLSSKELRELLDEYDRRGLDAARYLWLRGRLMAADFDWQNSGECALVFSWPKDCSVSGNCDMTIDSAMLKTPNV
jgi:hypothetical protein